MYALHALWRADGRLALWAESARAFASPRPRSRPTRPAGPAGSAVGPAGAAVGPGVLQSAEPQAHPFACPAGEVARLLAGIGPGLGWLAGQAPERWATLLLPTLGDAPTPSPQLPVGAVSPGFGPTPWRVPVLLFPPAEAAQLLGELFDPHWSVATADLPDLGPVEVAYGSSLRWLTAVHDLAWRLVGRGRLLPALRSHHATLTAHWQPALDAPARREAAALAAGCPPVLRAEHRPAPSPTPAGGAAARPAPRAAIGPTATALVAELLDVLVDQEARVALDGLPLPSAPPGDPLLGAWLAALYAPDGRLALPQSAAGAAELAEEIRERLASWSAGAPDPDSPLRLCFRLSEPLGATDDSSLDHTTAAAPGAPAAPAIEPGSDEGWRLDFLVQAVDQPSLLLSAADLWADGPAAAALALAIAPRSAHHSARLSGPGPASRSTAGGRLDPTGAADPTEALAAELSRAALRRPELAPALRLARPTGMDLDRAGALEFLSSAAPALAEAGFGVLLPAWWQKRPRLGLTLTAAPAPAPGSVERISQVDRDAVVAFQWQLALGEVELTERELQDLGAAQQGLVRLRGRWVEVDPAQISAALDFLRRRGAGVMAAPEVLRLALADGVSVAGLPVTAVRATGPLGDLLDGRSSGAGRPGAGRSEADAPPAAPVAPELPPDFGTTLRPYQARGLAWLHTLTGLGLGAVLADDMGLGKTVQALALLAIEQRDGTGGPNLLICPTSLVGNWQREAARFAPGLRVHVHHGADRTELPTQGVDLLITTYGLVQRDLAQLRQTTWRRVIADEAQHIKNAATGQARAVRSLQAAHRLALTGTPVENRLAELHAILDFANPGLFGTAESFKERFAVPMEQGGSAAVADQLRRLTAPFVLRRLKSDPAVAAELPAKKELTVWCHLTAEQAGLYQAVVADLLHRVQGVRGVERKGTVLAAIGKLKQVCNHPAQLLHDRSRLGERSGKVTRLEELLAEALAEGDKALVFTQYAEFGRRLQPHLAERLGEEVLYLHGGTPQRRRDELVDRFQSPDGPQVFLISLKAGGAGLNLTAANQVIHLDRWWNPAVEDQATDRAFRIGQRRDVQVRRLVCVGTVEERIGDLIEAKRTLAEAAVGEGERWITELSTGALRELIALSADLETP
ncbi:hypothetical protein CFP65_3330 [Kitasatospora sp. MMS16-BH015]|uniref:DEAD/DEAH box helicase n=1 Tax=Kitasatospora sp. MMS16-BH015 TaxID=2018025 RepID=UPI000CA3853F|nr:DEAD/DEAH box helicase [Kitasatospora sp. MMS16-BH015]AUG78129.1 hypothetical protein CFP65_3330 [Kitasatospora sp. MMS16-BH015]